MAAFGDDLVIPLVVCVCAQHEANDAYNFTVEDNLLLHTDVLIRCLMGYTTRSTHDWNVAAH